MEEGEGKAQVPVGAIEPTARPIEDAVKDSKHVMPMNLTNLHRSAVRVPRAPSSWGLIQNLVWDSTSAKYWGPP